MVGTVETRRSIDFLPDLHLDAAVLREPLLRDAHRAGHDLEPADYGRLQLLRRRLHFLEHAIDAETDAETFLERFEMDVARTELVRFEQEHRHHAHDRRVAPLAFRHLGACGDVEFLDRGVADLFPQNIDRFFGAAVIFDERLPDFFGRGANELDLAFQEEAEAVDAVEIERIAGRDDEAVFVARDRDHLEPARVLRLDLVDHFLGHDHVGEVDPVHLRLGGEAAGNVVRRDDPLPNESIDHAARAVEFGARFFDLLARHQTDIPEEIENVIFVRRWHAQRNNRGRAQKEKGKSGGRLVLTLGTGSSPVPVDKLGRYSPEMTNVEWTKECLMKNDEMPVVGVFFRHSTFLIPSLLDIRHCKTSRPSSASPIRSACRRRRLVRLLFRRLSIATGDKCALCRSKRAHERGRGDKHHNGKETEILEISHLLGAISVHIPGVEQTDKEFAAGDEK